MKEPQRLLDNRASGRALEKELLRAARDDSPSMATKASAMAALGIAGGLAAATQATAASAAMQTATAAQGAGAASTAAGAASTTAAAAVSLGKGVVLVKWVGIASVGLVGSATVIDRVTEPVNEPRAATIVSSVHAQPRPPRPQIAPTSAPKTAAQAAPSEAPKTADDETRARQTKGAEKRFPARTAPEVRTAGPTTRKAPPTGTATSAPSPRPQLSAEVAALDKAQRALRAGDGDGATRALNRYEQQFGKGRLADEAQVLQIETLALHGNKAAARARALSFLANHPNSPYASRLRTLVASH
jgi:TolA-binding protein